MSITLNGKTISIGEYATLIIDAAKKIIEREQSDAIRGGKTGGMQEEGTPVDAAGVNAVTPNGDVNGVQESTGRMTFFFLLFSMVIGNDILILQWHHAYCMFFSMERKVKNDRMTRLIQDAKVHNYDDFDMFDDN